MSVPERARTGSGRPEIAPALFRLLAEAALSRAALDGCGLPVAMADAALPAQPLSYINQAFESFFGYRAAEALGRPSAALLFAEPAAAERLFREPTGQMRLRARRKSHGCGHRVHPERSWREETALREKADITRRINKSRESVTAFVQWREA